MYATVCPSIFTVSPLNAFATAFVVLGKDSALQVMEREPNVEGYLIIPSASDSTQLEVVYSAGFEQYLKKE